MSATLIDGKAIALQIREEVRGKTAALLAERGIRPGLAFILVGEDPGSVAYVRSKGKACEEMGFYSVTDRLPADTPEERVLEMIREFNADRRGHGILVHRWSGAIAR